MIDATALLVSLFICANGGGAIQNGNCIDGSKAIRTDVKIITKNDNGESIIEMSRNGKILLSIAPDGKIYKDDSFMIDEAAFKFWQAVATTYRQVCPDIADVLQPLIDGAK